MCKGDCDIHVCTCDWELMHPGVRGPWVRLPKDSCEMHGGEA